MTDKPNTAAAQYPIGYQSDDPIKAQMIRDQIRAQIAAERKANA
jgi:hypothetical protein